MHPGRVWLEINGRKIRSNIDKITSYVKQAKVAAVLKADAYGIGLEMMLNIIGDSNVSAIAVAELEQALKVKGKGFPVFMLGALTQSEIKEIVKEKIIASVPDIETAEAINRISENYGLITDCQLLIDTGMGRLGFTINDDISIFKSLQKFKNLNFMGIYSHFPHAYQDYNFSNRQIDDFKKLLNKLIEIGFNFKWLHIANSDGMQNLRQSYSKPFNMVRTGINLYGFYDNLGKKNIDLDMALSLKSQIIQIRDLAKGSAIGYGKTYILPKDQKIATVPIGYADGLSVRQSNVGVLYVNGVSCPIVGRVSMDYTTILVEQVPNIKIGDVVECFTDYDTFYMFEEASGVNAYEVLTSIGSRVKRVLV